MVTQAEPVSPSGGKKEHKRHKDKRAKEPKSAEKKHRKKH